MKPWKTEVKLHRSAEIKQTPGLAHLCVYRVSAVFLLLFTALLLSTDFALAQKADSRPTAAPLDPAQAESEARALVADLLAKKPDQNTTNTGVLRIRDAKDVSREIPVRFEVASTSNGWVSTYETIPKQPDMPKETLKVLHPDGGPSQYFLAKGEKSSESKPLGSDQLMTPFAGSDFWLADLGLEFLHWPKQRLLKKEMRRYCFCLVLESTNPSPSSTNGYARVVSWIDSETGSLVHADAYNAKNELLKEFDPTELKKVEGQRQLEEMEMRNRKTGSHSWVKYNLK